MQRLRGQAAPRLPSPVCISLAESNVMAVHKPDDHRTRFRALAKALPRTLFDRIDRPASGTMIAPDHSRKSVLRENISARIRVPRPPPPCHGRLSTPTNPVSSSRSRGEKMRHGPIVRRPHAPFIVLSGTLFFFNDGAPFPIATNRASPVGCPVRATRQNAPCAERVIEGGGFLARCWRQR